MGIDVSLDAILGHRGLTEKDLDGVLGHNKSDLEQIQKDWDELSARPKPDFQKGDKVHMLSDNLVRTYGIFLRWLTDTEKALIVGTEGTNGHHVEMEDCLVYFGKSDKGEQIVFALPSCIMEKAN